MSKQRIVPAFMLLYIFMTCLTFAADMSSPKTLPPAGAEKLPRWRGFNLLEKFSKDWSNKPFVEEDFKLISSLGFNFVRLPLDYRTWIKDGDWTRFDEKTLKEIDQAVDWGKKYGIHVCINFHRAPGYTVASPPEKTILWTDPETQRICAMHWAAFAKRYKGIPNCNLSFNLFNEPAHIDSATYAAVATRIITAIRAEDPDRLIISDGLEYGHKPCHELIPLKVAQATRGYDPFAITHYKAPWVKGTDKMAVPCWPACKPGSEMINRQWLWKNNIEPWQKLEATKTGIMVGEFGAFNKTPHDVVLAWMQDCLENWKKAKWGWALWNFRGSFGILDSDRKDVTYEDFNGHKLDRKMLDLLQKY